VAIDFTVVVATLNRRELLTEAVKSLLAQSFDRDRFEILVVDNGSSDGTKEAVLSMAADAPHIRYVVEPRLGLSNARNRGMCDARGRLIAYFDDDALAEPDWLERLFEVFEAESDAGAAGGRIHVRWPSGKPRWMPAAFEGHYGRCDFGPARRTVLYPEYPYGSNMAFRTDILRSLRGFSDQVGRKGKKITPAGETELFYRLSQQRIRMVYEPSAVVHHLAAPSHVRRRWLLRRTFAHGRMAATMQYLNGPQERGLWLTRLGRGVGRSAGAFASSLTGLLTFREQSIVMSRLATAAYWGGVARTSATNLRRGRRPRPR
jgi:glycosyltransferase involved in cell wall biosynthesis